MLYEDVTDTIVGSLMLVGVIAYMIGFICLVHWVISEPIASNSPSWASWLFGNGHHEAERNNQHADQEHND